MLLESLRGFFTILTDLYIASNYSYDDGCIVGVGGMVRGISVFILQEMTPNTSF